MAELVDAHGSGPCALGCGGSSPLLGTNYNELNLSVDSLLAPAFNVYSAHPALTGFFYAYSPISAIFPAKHQLAL
jgi:hypothetical protein